MPHRIGNVKHFTRQQVKLEYLPKTLADSSQNLLLRRGMRRGSILMKTYDSLITCYGVPWKHRMRTTEVRLNLKTIQKFFPMEDVIEIDIV